MPASALIPVDSHTTAQGAIASFTSMHGTGQFIAPTAPADFWTTATTKIQIYDVDASASVTAGVLTLANTTNASARYFVLDFVCGNWNVPTPGVADSAISRAVFGVGFRVKVTAWSIKNTTNLTLGLLAAQVTLNAASSNYSVSSFGIPLANLAPLGAFAASGTGRYDAGAHQRVGQLEGELIDLVGSLKPASPSDSTVLVPQLVAVELDVGLTSDIDTQSLSTSYALQSIWSKSRSLNDALGKPPTGVSTDVVQRVYSSVVAADPTAKPTSKQKSGAKNMQFWGE